jgi:hypothetical protein
VVRPTKTGNPGVIEEVNNIESSIGYADLAQVRELKHFSEVGEGGEGTAKFWALVSNSKNKTVASKQTFQDASTNGDVPGLGNSNCKSTKYVSKIGEKFPPETTRKDWSKVKGAYNSATYGICGVTYALAARQYFFFEEPLGVSEKESGEKATTTENYLLWVLNKAIGGGQKEVEGQDYTALPATVTKISETGVKEIGNKVA